MKLGKQQKYLLLAITIIIVIIYYLVFVKKSYVTSVLARKSGFFSMLFFTFNHAIYANANHLNFRIDSEKWLFKYKDGWTDYFEPYTIQNQVQIFPINTMYPNTLADYSIADYKQIIPRIYRYNKATKEYIESMRRRINLPDVYDAFYIRRGDKIISGESKHVGVQQYVDLLYSRNPHASVVFIQTDDYGVIEEIMEYVRKLNRHLDIRTLCKKSERGTIVFNGCKNGENTNPKGSKEEEYMLQNKAHFEKNKTIEELNPTEMYEHIITMITSIEFVCNSNICITDYQSDVGRFIKLFHRQSSDVINVIEPEKDVDYSKKICPAHSF